RAASSARHHDRRRLDLLAAPHALHHTRGLPLSRSSADIGRAAAGGAGARAHARGGAKLKRPMIFGYDLSPVPPPASSVSRTRIKRTLRAGLELTFAVLLAMSVTGCPRNPAESKPQTKGQGQVVPVAVTVVEQKAMPVQINAIGTVEAFSIVSVR